MNAEKVVLITGVSRGLGRAMVGGFVAAGWTVAGCARSGDAIEKLQGEHAAPHVFAQADITKDAEVAAFCQRILKDVGTPDLVLNNAALINANAPLWEVPCSEFDAVIDANIKGTAAIIRHITPAMMKRGRGVIVNFSSG